MHLCFIFFIVKKNEKNIDMEQFSSYHVYHNPDQNIIGRGVNIY